MNNAIHTPISAIVFDATTQVRSAINSEVVADYAERMTSGDKFPPADLFVSNDDYYIGDGWHRLLAAQKNGDVTFPAVIHQGGRYEAVKFALGANAKHGMPRTNADKRRAVEVALKELGNLSDREVARVCAVHNTFVGKVRHELLTNSSSPSPAEAEARLGADGKIRKLPAMRHEPRGETEQKPREEAPTDIEPDSNAAGKKKRSAPFSMPARGLFIARGAILQLEQILPNDGERDDALRLVRDWCNQRITSR